MNTHKKITLSRLFFKVYHEKKSGVVIIKDDALTIKIFLDNGLLIHAEGIDKDTALIKEIGNRKGFSSDQLDI